MTMNPLIALSQGAVIGQLAFEDASRELKGRAPGRHAGRKAHRRRAGR
jgi:hypothetical protein